MRKYYLIFLYLFLFRNGLFDASAQEVPLIHKVAKGETKFGLARKYNISIEELERQNPHIVNMLQSGHELSIVSKAPKNNFSTQSTSSSISENGDYDDYLVEPGETLYGISRRYKITVPELVEINRAVLGSVLRSGQTLRVPSGRSNSAQNSNSDYEQHYVEVGETKWGLSRRYGVSISELEDLNPHIVKMLRSGDQISIPGRRVNKPIAKQEVVKEEPKPVVEKPVVEKTTVEKPVAEKQKPVEKQEVVVQSESNVSTENLVTYEVKPKETLYGLSKSTGLSEEKLIALNPELSNGLKAGMLLKIPAENAARIPETKVAQNDNVASGLLKTIQKGQQKEIAFLLPFSEEGFVNRIKSSNENPEIKRALDFYAGAIIAMDSLKKSEVLVTSKVFEIKSSEISEEEIKTITAGNFQNYKAVFSPTESDASVKLGKLLTQNNTPIIISDSKKTTTTSATTYNSSVPDVQLKKLILDYIVSKKQNLIVVSDATRKESRNYITQNYPEAQFVKIDQNGVLDSESLKSLLNSSKKNYVVLDTDKAGLILTATNLLLQDSKQYDLQIALLEPKANIKGEDLSEMRFKALKMMYPSTFRPKGTTSLNVFKKDFSRKYGFEPTDEAIKGFDVTFDALVRLFQEKNFEVLANENTTEQLKLSFKYIKDLEAGYVNSAGYILQYDENTDAKIVN